MWGKCEKSSRSSKYYQELIAAVNSKEKWRFGCVVFFFLNKVFWFCIMFRHWFLKPINMAMDINCKKLSMQNAVEQQVTTQEHQSHLCKCHKSNRRQPRFIAEMHQDALIGTTISPYAWVWLALKKKWNLQEKSQIPALKIQKASTAIYEPITSQAALWAHWAGSSLCLYFICYTTRKEQTLVTTNHSIKRSFSNH